MASTRHHLSAIRNSHKAIHSVHRRWRIRGIMDPNDRHLPRSPATHEALTIQPQPYLPRYRPHLPIVRGCNSAHRASRKQFDLLGSLYYKRDRSVGMSNSSRRSVLLVIPVSSR
ncbi:hypothetical protein ANTRET_LOCUS7421 [Anthophora retusa]